VTAVWFDARGCLTEAGLAAVRAAAPAAPPPELAGHIAGCSHCQDRLLALGRPVARAPVAAPTGVQRWRLAILTGAVLAMALFALWTIWRLAAGRD
jgi:hypothetical protein